MDVDDNHTFEQYKLPRLLSFYKNPQSKFFLVKNEKLLYKLAKEDSQLYDITLEEISKFKSYVEALARSNKVRILRGHSRRYGFRAYRTFSDRHIIAGDLAFLQELQNYNSGIKIILVLIDVNSRLISLTPQKTATASETLESYLNALKNTFGVSRYPLFQSDRGSEFK